MSEPVGALDRIERFGIVPVVTIDDAERAVPLALALAAGGLPVAEVTLRTAAGLGAIRAIADSVAEVLVGAGSVMTETDATAAIDAGARFLVSPGFDDGVVDLARDRSVAMLPGIATATELMRAHRRGLDVVKMFPAEAIGGISLLSSLAAVWPDTRFVPTGGISPTNAADYLGHDSVLAVGGSWMVPRDVIASGDWAAITRLAGDAVAIVEAAR